MLDSDLAELYQVPTKVLNQAVMRNLVRFPKDFMFQLNKKETDFMVSHFAIPSRKHLGGSQPYVFTEQGVVMLSSVLNSERAIQANILRHKSWADPPRILAENHEDIFEDSSHAGNSSRAKTENRSHGEKLRPKV